MAIPAMKQYSRGLSTLFSNPLRVCIVGSGPAGFYTAEKLLKKHDGSEVDIIDRLPMPFGLVRSGVAPDHPETKIVTNQFSRVVEDERCSFLGNVSLGSSISLPELRDMYDVVVLAYGAESDRVLGIPGEAFIPPGSLSGGIMGTPDYSELAPDLKNMDTAVVLGQGNVALDVARILLRPTEELAKTDIASHAISALADSSIRKVYLVGRRGPVQVACTAKELREILGLKDLYIHINDADLIKVPGDEELLKNNRIQRRVYELLSRAATSGTSAPSPGQRELHFIFFRKPDRFLESDEKPGHVAGVQFEKTILKVSSDVSTQMDTLFKQRAKIAVGTGQFEKLESGMVLKSIGYKSVPVDGLSFDHDKGIVPNVGGRVLSHVTGNQSLIEKGLYVCGWLKRGPTGIIGTNLYCAEETLSSISEDLESGKLKCTCSTHQKPGREGLLQLLDSRNVRVVPFGGWAKIDNEEKRRGMLKNKPREKLTTWDELLKIAIE